MPLRRRHASSAGMTDPTAGERALRTRVLLLLLFAYIFNFIDRNIAGVLAVPIREEFQLSDTALSQLGIAFGIFYAVIAIPIAWAADRKSRVNIISTAIALWSLFTAACGLAQSYTQLVVARMGVAVGEAGGTVRVRGPRAKCSARPATISPRPCRSAIICMPL